MAVACLSIASSGCKSSIPTGQTLSQQSAEKPQSNAPQNSNWSYQEQNNAIDDSVDQFLTSGFKPSLIIAFHNGELQHGSAAGVLVSSPCFVEGSDEGVEYRRTVRTRFDVLKPLTEVWDITDDHYGIAPREPPAIFIRELMQHSIFMIEFGCSRSDYSTFQFDVSGLADALAANHLSIAKEEAREAAAARAAAQDAKVQAEKDAATHEYYRSLLEKEKEQGKTGDHP